MALAVIFVQVDLTAHLYVPPARFTPLLTRATGLT